MASLLDIFGPQLAAYDPNEAAQSLDLNNQRIQANQLAMQQAQAQAAAAAQQMRLSRAYQIQALQDPTPENITRWAIASPEQYQAIKSAHDQLDADTRNQNLRDMSAIYGYLDAGNNDAAAAAVQRRIDADRKAGHDTSDDEAVLAQIKSNPTQAKAVVGLHLAATMGADKFTEAYGKIGSEQRENDAAPGKIALTAAQTAQAQAAAARDHFLTVGDQVYPIDVQPPGAAQPAPSNGQPSATPAAVPGPAGARVEQVARSVGASDADVDYLARTAALESSGKPKAQNGKSTGVFQLQPETAKDLGVTDINSVDQQTVATLKNAQVNGQKMRGMLGRNPTAPELYLAHQQGAAGASGLISAATHDPNATAVQALIDVGVKPGKAKASILKNGGTADMTAGQFVQMWTDKYNNALGGQPAAQGGQGSPQGAEAVAADGTRYRLGAPVGGGATEETGMTPDAIDMNAMRYAMTGQLPPTGVGKQAAADKRAIMNRASEVIKQYGIKPEDWVTGMAQFKVTQGSLSQISKVQAMVSASEATVDANMGIVLRLAPKGGGPSGSPALNAPIQYLRKQVWGSKDVAAFDAAIGTVADEYAKVMTSSTGTGGQGTSDAARKEAYDRLSKAATLGQLQSVITVMRQEMANRRDQLGSQANALTEQLRHGVVGGSTPAPTPAPEPTPPGPRRKPLSSFGR